MSLYTKYRPGLWSAMIGQNAVKIVLESEISNNSLSHAYLFYGPRGVGKTTVARLFAKSVNCTGRVATSSEPCLVCFNCLAFKSGTALDVIEIDAASHTGVDNVRENIIEHVRFSPHSSKYKVFIIDEVHMLSTQAFNALLKSLEEPPAHVIFILATTEMHKIPATILSRCQVFQFKKLTTTEIVQRLGILAEREKVQIDTSILREVARISEGSLRDAESLMGQIFSLSTPSADGTYCTISFKQAHIVIPETYFHAVLELLQYVQGRNTSAAIRHINTLRLEGKDMAQFLNNTLEFLRKLLLLKISPELNEFSMEFDPDTETQIGELSAGITKEEVLRLISLMIEEKNINKYAVIESLPLELAVLKYTHDIHGAYQVEPRNTVMPLAVNRQTENKPEKIPEKENETAAEINIMKEMVQSFSPAPSNEVVASVVTVKEEPVSSALTFDDVKQKWNVVLERLEDRTPSIPLMLRTAKLLDAENNCLRLGLKYKFHSDRISTLKIKSAIEQVMAEVYGFPLRIEALCMPEMVDNVSNPMVDTILEQFGGQVI